MQIDATGQYPFMLCILKQNSLTFSLAWFVANFLSFNAKESNRKLKWQIQTSRFFFFFSFVKVKPYCRAHLKPGYTKPLRYGFFNAPTVSIFYLMKS